MKDDFEFQVRWLERIYGTPAERETFGELEIRWRDQVLTELEDLFAGTVRSGARVSLLHLGAWLVSNWWRLRWEPLPVSIDLDWRLAHEIGAAGGGFAWPDLLFAADGETVSFSLRDTLDAGPPVRYLRRVEGSMRAGTFERAVDALLSVLWERLSSRHVNEPDLQEAWSEVLAERRNPEVATRRRREALLGFDPDAIDAAELATIVQAGSWMGDAALEETMVVGRGSTIHATLDTLKQVEATPGLELDLTPLVSLGRAWRHERPRSVEPWQRGAELARRIRHSLGLSLGDAVTSERLADLVGNDVTAARPPCRGPFAAGFCAPDARHRVTFHGVRRHPTSRRFEAARLLADALDGPAEDRMLPMTDASTARQKVQRSFAQEFLCPAEGLACLVSIPTPSDAELEIAADHFQVSELTVRSALVNRGLVHREYLSGPRGGSVETESSPRG